MAARGKTVPVRPAPSLLFEVDLGDSALVARLHPDGMYTLDINSEVVVVDADQMRAIATGFVGLAKAKGWT
jgi:hypothetical protein